MKEEEYYQQVQAGYGRLTKKLTFGHGRLRQVIRHGCGCLTAALFIIALLAMLTGCRTQYVPVETIKTEYIVKHDSVTLRDSIWQHDSVYVERSGDTLLVEKWRTKYVEHLRDVVKIDSFIKTDSIRVPYPVERKLSRFEQFKMDYGAVSFGVSIAAIIALVVFIILWLRRKSKL